MSAAEYRYAKLDPKWHLFILTLKIYDILGLRPDTDLITGLSATADEVIVYTTRELTEDQKLKLETLFKSSEAGFYPTTSVGFTVFEIQDIFDYWRKLEETLGVKIKYVFANVPFHDKIELWLQGTLTTAKKNQLRDAYAGLIKEKVV